MLDTLIVLNVIIYLSVKVKIMKDVNDVVLISQQWQAAMPPGLAVVVTEV